jgi:hypothetical protein
MPLTSFPSGEVCLAHNSSPPAGEFAIHTLEQDLTTLLALPPLQHNYGTRGRDAQMSTRTTTTTHSPGRTFFAADEMQKQFAMGAAACLIRHFEVPREIPHLVSTTWETDFALLQLLSDSNNINKWHLKSHNFGQVYHIPPLFGPHTML